MVKKRKILSPSRMMVFNKCKRQYEFRDEPFFTPVTDETARTFGKSVHKGIELYYGGITQHPSTATIRSVLDREFKRAWDSRLSTRLRNDYNTCKANFQAFEFWRLKQKQVPFKPDVVEVDLSSDKLHAKCDWFKDGRLIDFKTNKKAELDVQYQLELWTQAEVLKFHGHEVKVLELFFLRHNKFIKVPKPNFSWLYQQRQTILDSIIADEFPPTRTILCHWCDHKLRCDYTSSTCKAYHKRKFRLWSDTVDPFYKTIMPQWITHELEY